jgi:hypothetical protein
VKDATKLAIGIALLWIAGVAFFVAFHPNGVVMPDGNPAKNPQDVLKYLMWKARGGGEGGDSSGQQSGGQDRQA